MRECKKFVHFLSTMRGWLLGLSELPRHETNNKPIRSSLPCFLSSWNNILHWETTKMWPGRIFKAFHPILTVCVLDCCDLLAPNSPGDYIRCIWNDSAVREAFVGPPWWPRVYRDTPRQKSSRRWICSGHGWSARRPWYKIERARKSQITLRDQETAVEDSTARFKKK